MAPWFRRNKEAPQMMTEGITKDIDTMRGILDSEDWTLLQGKLQEYVQNYTQKIIHVTGGFQL